MVAEPSWVLHVSSKRHRYSIWIGPHPWPAVTPYPTGFILTLRAFSHFPSFSTLLRIPLELCRHGRGQDHDAHLWKMGTSFMSKRVSGWMKQTTASWPPCTKQGKQTLPRQMIPGGSNGGWGWDTGLTGFTRNITLTKRGPLVCSHNASYSRSVQSPRHRNPIWDKHVMNPNHVTPS